MKKFIQKAGMFSIILALQFSLLGQTPSQNWMLNDYQKDGVPGISAEKAYQLLAGRTPKKVIVAVIDSGVDIYHEDLKDVIWVNKGEIPNNGKDDDENGYIDDIHGWNFIGGKDGSNVNQDTYEITRIYARLKKKYEGKTAANIDKKDKKEFELYTKIKAEIQQKIQEYSSEKESIQALVNDFKNIEKILREQYGINEITTETLSSFKSNDEKIQTSVLMLNIIMMQTGSPEFNQLIKDLESAIKFYSDAVNYGYNENFDPRPIVGDNYENSSERYYGNNDVKGPDPSHGTHVAGIIAAKRGNGIGIDGIADNVEIMVIRVVPNGDERDKDVANGIRYAADNGAKVINMSFGKKYIHDKAVVDEAVRYAESKGVLLIHAGGNEAEDIDIEKFYPTRKLLKGSAKNWMEIGALNWKPAPEMVGSFSNYGKKNLDLFAPGVDIYSTYPEHKYEFQQGTSMAAPVVSGVAAVLFSYFPSLKAADIKKAILSSVQKFHGTQVFKPGTEQLVDFKTLSKTGGVVNLYKAVETCIQMSKKT